MSAAIDDSRIPVIVGAAQFKCNVERRADLAREPLDLIVDVLTMAADDSGAGSAVLRSADFIGIPSVGSWAYDDLPGMVAASVGATHARGEHTAVGGNRPAELLDRAAQWIASGEMSVALLAGAETQVSLHALKTAGAEPAWTREPGGKVQYGEDVRGSQRMWTHGLMAPVRVYPLYENALRAALGQTFDEAQQWSAEILADFTQVASGVEAAWNRTVRTPEQIRTVTPDNRYICFPYPLLMNSFPYVDQAAGVVVTSVARARELGVRAEQMIHVWGGAGAADSKDILDRSTFESSPGLEHAIQTALDQACIDGAQLDVIDLYSCFPVVPKLGILALGLERDHRVTATGGNAAFGGPGNNFSMHAIVAVTNSLRRSGRLGMVYANGEYVTKHHAIVLATEAHPEGYVGRGGDVTATGLEAPHVVDVADGVATIETATVEFDRQGQPQAAFVIGRLSDESRFAANGAPGDAALLARLTDPDAPLVGARIDVQHRDGRNLVSVPAI